jgi:cytochrome c-type protein NapB
MPRRLSSSVAFLVCCAAAFALAAAEPARAPAPPGKEVEDGLDVPFREVEILSTAPQAQEVYIETAPGESKNLERAYPGAPPQVPHEMESMLPITGESNDCLECHLPENATEKKDVPTPKSHFERPIVGESKPGEAMVTVVKGYEKQKELLGSRYHCNMCHVPQATNVEPLPKAPKAEAPAKK